MSAAAVTHSYFCAECGRSFRSPVHLRVHSRTHTRDNDASAPGAAEAAAARRETRAARLRQAHGGRNINLNEVCFICCDAAPDVVLEPCGHATMCWTCATQLATCPLCRKNIFSVRYDGSEDAAQTVTAATARTVAAADSIAAATAGNSGIGPPRPPVLSGDTARDRAAMQQWVSDAAVWQQEHVAESEKLNENWQELERYTKEASSWYEQTAKWQEELNTWWESAVQSSSHGDDAVSGVWYKMWCSVENAYYYWNEADGTTTWEPQTPCFDYADTAGGSSGSGGGGGGFAPAMVAVYVLQCAVRRWLARRRKARLAAARRRGFRKALSMASLGTSKTKK